MLAGCWLHGFLVSNTYELQRVLCNDYVARKEPSFCRVEREMVG